MGKVHVRAGKFQDSQRDLSCYSVGAWPELEVLDMNVIPVTWILRGRNKDEGMTWVIQLVHQPEIRGQNSKPVGPQENIPQNTKQESVSREFRGQI